MKGWIVCLFMLYTGNIFSQEKNISFALIDQKARSVKAAEPKELAARLTAGYTNDLDKVRSIFTWITTHIRYQDRFPVKKYPRIIDDDDGPLKPLDERIAINVINRGEAVCDGYARLFKTLCTAAGIPAAAITGYARLNYGKSSFRSNHTWNAVQINGTWQLLDVTWAAGYFAESTGYYVPQVSEKYFLTAPETFIEDHYPEDLQWTLLAVPPDMREYRFSPFLQSAFIRNRVTAFSPSKGIIEAMPGDTVFITIESADQRRNLRVTDNPYRDLAGNEALYDEMVTPDPLLRVKGNTMTYPFVIKNPSAEWLTVLYNGEIIIRYRLVVDNKRSSLAAGSFEKRN